MSKNMVFWIEVKCPIPEEQIDENCNCSELGKEDCDCPTETWKAITNPLDNRKVMFSNYGNALSFIAVSSLWYDLPSHKRRVVGDIESRIGTRN